MSTVTSPWEMETKKGGGAGDGKPFEDCPAGNYPATLVGIFDVGNQPSLDDNKQPIERRQVVLVFELMKKDSTGKPYLMSAQLRKTGCSVAAYLPADAFWALPEMISSGAITHIEARFDKPSRGSGDLQSLYFATAAKLDELG